MENQTVYFFLIITTSNNYKKLHGNQCMKNNTRNVENQSFFLEKLVRRGVEQICMEITTPYP